MNEKRIAELMKSLGCTRAEAIQVIEEDEAIDRGEKLYELSADQKKVARSMTATGTKKSSGTVKRERKPDEEKQEIIAKIANFLKEIDGFDVEIIKNEREISLLVGDNNYSITLTKHRPPKK